MGDSFSTKTEYIDLNIVILPDAALSLKLIQWSRITARRFKVDYILDLNNHLPHLSLYSARYPKRNIQQIEKIILDISKCVRMFNIVLKGFSVFSGYVFL